MWKKLQSSSVSKLVKLYKSVHHIHAHTYCKYVWNGDKSIRYKQNLKLKVHNLVDNKHIMCGQYVLAHF